MSVKPSAIELSQRTVVFLVTDSQVLLGYKKTGFGQGNYLGIGGKIEVGETEQAATIREMAEEIHVKNPVLVKVADLTFLFPHQPSWSQQVHIFICSQWDGQPMESDEIKPEWFDKNHLPFSNMWDDAQFWLPAILNAHSLKGSFTFNSELKVTKVSLTEQTFG